jgi:hypothetical protein
MNSQGAYHKKMQESSMMNEDKFANMLEKISEEQKGFYNQKKHHELQVK